MFLFLSKLLPLLIYPVGLACLLLLAALAVRRRTRLRAGLVVAAFLCIWLGGNRIVAMATARALEWQYPPLAQGATADVILVLGGATRELSPPRTTHELNEAGDRLLYAKRLWEAGAAPRILVVGGGALYVGPGNIPEAESMAEILRTMGVSADAILMESRSRNTWENASNAKLLLNEIGAESVILVTSALHMPRAVAIFRRLEIPIQPAPVDYLVTEADWAYYLRADAETWLFNLIPSADDLRLTSMALKEYVGFVIYRLRGWA